MIKKKGKGKKKDVEEKGSEEQQAVQPMILKSKKQIRLEKERKKQEFIRRFVLFGLPSITLIVVVGYKILEQGMIYYQGDMTFGVCRVYAEQRTTFPQTVEFNSVEEFGGVVKIFYSHIDAYGVRRLEEVMCQYKQKDPRRLKVILFNGEEIPEDELAAFKATIPGIMKYPPELSFAKKVNVVEPLIPDL